MLYPKSFQNLIHDFASLPSVGPKMAERLVLFLFKQDKEKLEKFAENILAIKNLRICQKCFNISEDTFCEICQSQNRNPKIICIVEEPMDIISFEKTGAFKGIYHVLGGTISFGNENSDLKIPQLLTRIEKENVEEIILATNPTTEGDATALYLKKKIENLNTNIKITRLARGLATGGDIEYADEITLSSAINNRREI